MKKYLLSYNDDNHDNQYWFDGEYLGTDVLEILKDMYYYGLEDSDPEQVIEIETIDIYIFDLNDDVGEIVHNLLSKGGMIRKPIWQALINKDYQAIEILQKYNED